MEAKEIVAQEVARQKEFGYEPSWEDFVIAGQQAGIREVVDYLGLIKTISLEGDGYVAHRFVAEKEEWQAKLKEWGITDANK